MSHIFNLRVYIEDTDYGGVVYHANYLNYFERARSEWAEEIGCGIEQQKQLKIYFPVRYANVEYLKPARVSEQLQVISKIISIRKASLIYQQYLRPRDSTDTILCQAQIKIACVDYAMRPQALPTFFKNLLVEN